MCSNETGGLKFNLSVNIHHTAAVAKAPYTIKEVWLHTSKTHACVVYTVGLKPIMLQNFIILSSNSFLFTYVLCSKNIPEVA